MIRIMEVNIFEVVVFLNWIYNFKNLNNHNIIYNVKINNKNNKQVKSK